MTLARLETNGKMGPGQSYLENTRTRKLGIVIIVMRNREVKVVIGRFPQCYLVTGETGSGGWGIRRVIRQGVASAYNPA